MNYSDGKQEGDQIRMILGIEHHEGLEWHTGCFFFCESDEFSIWIENSVCVLLAKFWRIRFSLYRGIFWNERIAAADSACHAVVNHDFGIIRETMLIHMLDQKSVWSPNMICMKKWNVKSATLIFILAMWAFSQAMMTKFISHICRHT